MATTDGHDPPIPARALLQGALDAADIPMIAWNLHGSPLAWNEACCRSLGYSPDQIEALTRPDIFPPEDHAEVEACMQRRLAGNRDVEIFTGRLRTSGGKDIWVNGRSAPVIDGDRVTGDVVSYSPTDLTLGEALDQQFEQYLALFERLSDAVYVLDREGRMSWMNRAAERLFGRTLAVLQRTPREDLLFPEALRGQDQIRENFASGGSAPDEIGFRLRRPDGDVRWVRGSLLMLRDAGGHISRSVVIARDVTEERKRQQELREQAQQAQQAALIDPLTGLPNRRAFDDAMEWAAEQVQAGHSMSLLVVDADDLKELNDTYGHAVGDDALRTVAQSLTARTRATDQVFRIGGDEFAVITAGGDPAVLAERLAAPIRFREPVPWLSVSVGRASWDETGEVFETADRRMYEMKRVRSRQP